MARVLLAAVFLVAGISKLTDRAGWRGSLSDFGVPLPLVVPVGALLPPIELGLAAALLVGASARWGALGALVLLAGFGVAMAINLARGRTPDCHCFGRLGNTGIGWRSVVRNVILACVAGLVVLEGGRGEGIERLGGLSALGAAVLAGSVLAAVVALEGWFLVGLHRLNSKLSSRLDALEAAVREPGNGGVRAPTSARPRVGSPPPEVALMTLAGQARTIRSLLDGRPVLLVFSDVHCGPCTALSPRIAAWQQEHSRELGVWLISRGRLEANRDAAARYGLTNVLLQRDREVAEAYGARATPSALLLHPDGTIWSAVALGADQIEGLVASALRDQRTAVPSAPAKDEEETASGNGGNPAAPPRAPQIAEDVIGAPAPRFKLSDASGSLVDFPIRTGRATLVLLLSPDCPYCDRVIDRMQAWEAAGSGEGPAVVVVSTGLDRTGRPEPIGWPVVLDPGFEVGRAIGAGGTPSAVLIDARGNIASQVAQGAPAILGLAGIHLDRPQNQLPSSRKESDDFVSAADPSQSSAPDVRS